MGLILADVRVQAATDEVARRTGMAGSWWHAPNGRVWALHDPSQGVVLAPGVQGLSMPQYDLYTSTTMLPGARHRGSRAQSRDVFWPIYISETMSGRDYLTLDRDFFAGMDPDQWGWWEWRSKGQKPRFLRVQFVEESAAPERDPAMAGWGAYGIKMVAHQPFWEGEDEPYRFAHAEGQPWMGTPDRPGIFISSGRDTATAAVSNAGTEPAWPVWRIDGPASDIVVGVSGRLTTMSFSVPAGGWVEIDTRQWGPRGFGAWDNTGRRLSDQLTRFEPAPIPPGSSVPVTVSFTGQGMITCTLAPLFKRAW